MVSQDVHCPVSFSEKKSRKGGIAKKVGKSTNPPILVGILIFQCVWAWPTHFTHGVDPLLCSSHHLFFIRE